MCADYRQPAGPPRLSRDRHGGRGRRRVWLCLLALLLQQVSPGLHIWGETWQPAVIAVPAAEVVLPLADAPSRTLLTAATTARPRLPHDMASCTVCQHLAHHWAWPAPHAWTVCHPAVTSALLFFPVVRPASPLAHAVAARAPPSLL